MAEPKIHGTPAATTARVRSPRADWTPWRATDRYFRDLVLSMQNGVIAVTRDGRIAMMNEVARRILQVSDTGPLPGRQWRQVFARNGDIIRIFASAFELSHLPNRAELRLKSSGKVIGYTLSHIRDGRGRIIGAVLFFKDLTRVEQLEERERLRDRLAALGEMAAAIAHEVKNPLAGIEVMAGVLRRQLSDSPDAQSVLTDIINEAKVANGIVLEILEFVRPIRLQLEQVDLGDVIAEAATIAATQVEGGREVALHVACELPRIEGDGQQLRQLFINLLVNAFEATAAEGRVEIQARTPGPHRCHEADPPEPSMVAVDVIDDGPGVPEEIRDRIFSPFFTTKPRGSGLGLAIVRKIVDAHDGRIDMTVRPQGGTRFRVSLPVRALADEPEADEGRT